MMKTIDDEIDEGEEDIDYCTQCGDIVCGHHACTAFIDEDDD